MENTQVLTGRTWKERLETKISDFWQWVRHDVDWPKVGAAAVEIPRYTVAFTAIHEPWYFGVPLATLLTFSTAAGWEYAFGHGWRRAWFVWLMNFAVLAIAVCIITPVIYLMMSVPIHEVDMTKFDLWTADPVQLVWAFTMSLCTFVPIMLYSAVKAGRIKDAAAAKIAPTPTPTPAPVATPAPVRVEEDQPKVEHKPAKVVAVDPVVVMDAHKNGASEPLSQDKLEAWQMSKNGYTQDQIAGKYNKSDRTIRNWIKEVEDSKGEQG